MGFIPRHLVELGTERRFALVESGGFKEKVYDELVARNPDLLGELLFKAGALEEGGRLKLLGREVQTAVGRIDVLLAEVSPSEEEFRRLVLVENKLQSNPEAKRSVVGQILEYAGALKDKAVEFAELLVDDAEVENERKWLETHQEAIIHSLLSNDYVLVVSGDDIHANLQRLVRNFARQAARDPLIVADLCLVSWSIFADPEGKQRIVVPQLVGGIIGAERELSIRVHVGADGRRSVSLTQEQGVRAESATEDQFFGSGWIPKFGPDAVAEWRAFAEALLKSGIPGLELRHTKTGRPMLVLAGAAQDEPLRLLQPRQLKREIRDVFEGKAWTPFLPVTGEFRKTLLQLKGAKAQNKGHIHVPMPSAAAAADKIAEALRLLVEALKA